MKYTTSFTFLVSGGTQTVEDYKQFKYVDNCDNTELSTITPFTNLKNMETSVLRGKSEWSI